MSLLADFDPLTSPSNGAPLTPSASASSSRATSNFKGVTLDFLYSSKWHSLRPSTSTQAVASVSFQKPTSCSTSSHVLDPIEKLTKEREEKVEREREEKKEAERVEKKRQEDAITAAAAGKELIPVDTKKVELPSPKAPVPAASSSSSSLVPSSSSPPPLDPELQKQQAELVAALNSHDKEVQERNRYVGKSVMKYLLTQTDSTKPSVEYQACVTLDKTTLTLTDVTKRVVKENLSEEVKPTEVQGTFHLQVSADGKKLTGSFADGEQLDFELIDSSDPSKALEQLLGL